MKLKLTLLSLAMAAVCLPSMGQTTRVFPGTADTWIRENDPSWKQNTSWEKLEIRKEALKNDAGETVGYANYAGLYGFDFAIPTGMKVESATLRLVTERWKGCPVKIYGYGNNFLENTTWSAETDYIKTALAAEHVALFTPAAQRNAALGSDAIGDAYRDISAWTNNIDVTSHVKSLRAGTDRVNFLLVAAEDNTNQNCFYTREATDVTNAKDATITFSAKDLVPQLTVTFVEDSDTEVGVILPSADLYVRSTAATTNYGKNAEMELKNFEDGNGNRQYFVGLMSFNLPAEINSDEYEIKSVNLRLVATMAKGSRNIDIYPYNYEFTEGVNWEGAGVNVLKALQNDPIKSFEVKGQSASMSADALNDSYKTVEAWTNNIDLTDHVKQSLPLNTLSIMLDHQETGDRPVKFATKETSTITNAKDASVTFDAKDLVPQLTVIYTKKETQEPEQPEEPEEPEQPENLGDANGNGAVTVSDIVIIANYIAGMEGIDIVFDNANVVKEDDGSEEVIDIADLGAVTDIVLGRYTPQNARRLAADNTGAGRLVADNFKCDSEQPMTLGVALDNFTGTPYVALQGTIVLPEGMAFEGIELAGATARTHNIVANEIEPGRINVVIHSLSNTPFDMEDGQLFNLSVTALDPKCGNVTMEAIKVTDASYKRYTLTFDGGLNETGTNGIADALDSDEENAEYYTLQGVRVLNPDRGIFIRVANGTATKIIR